MNAQIFKGDDAKQVIIVDTQRLTDGDYRNVVTMLERMGYAVTIVCGSLPIEHRDVPQIDMESIVRSMKREPVPRPIDSRPYYRRFEKRRY